MKATCQKVPLCSTSMQPPSLHLSWPTARLKHVKRLCSDVKQYNKACVNFVDSVKTMIPNHSWLSTPERIRLPASVASRGNSWLVIPFHSSLIRCRFQKVLREIGVLAEYLGLGSFVPRVAWSRLKSNIGEHVSSHFYSVGKGT